MDSPQSPSGPQPPQQSQYDGRQQDVLDFAEFAIDQDHRKRRRNRTTQSCLNCHTSKRKCDRKRPCSRCIQLGLTGLCVYEVDDPALRDDPNVDEATRLRNRIAELESLVRELRGKPHPRWADSSFGDGDPQDKWHSRASKRPQISLSVRRHRDHLALGSVPDFHTGILSQQSPSIKSEPGGDFGGGFPYRFSPSPESHTSSPYASYPPGAQGYADVQAHAAQQGGHYRDPHGPSSDAFYSPYSPHPPNFPSHVHGHHRGSEHASPASFCACVANPGAAHPMILLSQQLRTALQALMALPEHGHAHQAQACILTRRVKELNDLLHSLATGHSGGDPASFQHQQPRQQAPHPQHPHHPHPLHHQQQQGPHSSHAYAPPPPPPHHAMHYNDALSTPPDSEVMTPLSSAESAPVSAAQLHEWAVQAQGASFNPYFPPLPPADKAHAADEYVRQSAAAAMVA